MTDHPLPGPSSASAAAPERSVDWYRERNRELVSDFNGMLVLNARLSRELEALDQDPGWTVSTADLLAKVPTRDLLDEIGRRCAGD